MMTGVFVEELSREARPEVGWSFMAFHDAGTIEDGL